MTPEQITSEWLSSVLGADVRLTATRRIGDGLIGMNIRLSIETPEGSDLPDSLVAKLPSDDPASRNTGVALGNYEREIVFYEHIAPTVDIRVPHCYHLEWDPQDGEFMLLLEDLAPGEQGDQLVGSTPERSRVAIVELARLHGPRWGDPTLSELGAMQRPSAEMVDVLQMLWGMFVEGFLAGYSKYLDSEGVDLVRRFGQRIPDWMAGRDMPATVTHGDYRLDNLMFATEAGGYPVAVVDWQTLGHGPAATDVSYFLGAGPLPELRRQIERGLVDEYLEALGQYGVTVDSGEFWRHYRREAYGGVITSVIATQAVGSTERSEAMFAAMASRHVRHILDLGAEDLI